MSYLDGYKIIPCNTQSTEGKDFLNNIDNFKKDMNQLGKKMTQGDYDKKRKWSERKIPVDTNTNLQEIANYVKNLFQDQSDLEINEAQIATVDTISSDELDSINDKHITENFGYHFDGASDENKKELDVYKFLVGVLLDDLPNENCGNFTLWKGSHVLASDYLDLTKPDIDELVQFARTKSSFQKYKEKYLASSSKFQFTGSKGDIIICHHMLLHGTSLNIKGVKARDMSFFRLSNSDFLKISDKNPQDYYCCPIKWWHKHMN